MTKPGKMTVGVAWVISVASAWIVTTAVLAALIGTTAHRAGVSAVIHQAMGSAALASIVVGGPATAVALRLLLSASRLWALLGGLATAVLVVAFLYSYLAAYGSPVTVPGSAVAPVFVVALAEVALSLLLRRPRAAPAAALSGAPDSGGSQPG